MSLTAREIINTFKDMSARPEFYSGRGATTSDLTSSKLEKIYQLVLKEHGTEAAKAFVQMVFDTKVLSATAFLNRFYQLEQCGWRTIGRGGMRDTDHIDVGRGDKPDLDAGMASIANVMFGSLDEDRDESLAICGDFLRAHEEEIAADEKDIEKKLRPRHGKYGFGIYG